MAVAALLFLVAFYLGVLIVYCAVRDLMRGWRYHRDIGKRKRGEW